MTRELTYGERAVGATFNPSGNDDVHQIKIAYANLIDMLDRKRQGTVTGEAKRLYSIAITEAQTAQMWAVKATTWPDV